MDFAFTSEQEALRETVRRFAEAELAPLVREADDTAPVNALMQAVETVADPDVPTLSAVIAVRLEDGEELVQNQCMTASDYSYDRARTMELMRRIGAEEGVPAEAYDRMEGFVMGLPGGSMEDVVRCFALLPRRG